MATHKKKITLNELGNKIDALTIIVEKGFAATAADIADIRRDMATKDQVIPRRRER